MINNFDRVGREERRGAYEGDVRRTFSLLRYRESYLMITFLPLMM